MKARYDGLAEWYDGRYAGYGAGESSSAEQLRRLLGPGEGWCLDIACGTGLHFDAITASGRRVIGIDISADQLRMARRRSSFLALASALHLPFADESFDTVTTTYLHTDIDSMAPVFVEAYRVLRKRGTFVYLGTHPCFIGHFIEIRDDGARVIHPGYHQNGWHTASPFFRAEGLGIRVGFRHVPLTELVNSLLACGLQLVRLEEPSVEDPPGAIALVATKE